MDPSSDFRRKFLWSFALLFLCLAPYRAQYWFQDVGYELNSPTQSLAEFVRTAVREGGLLLFLALCLAAFLSKVVGPPFSIRHSGAEEPGKPAIMNERPEQKIGSGPDWGRRLIWLFALVFVCAASVWALVWVDCALTGGGWSRPKGLVLIYSIALGLVPLLLALGLVVVLWRFEGSPFSSPRKKE